MKSILEFIVKNKLRKQEVNNKFGDFCSWYLYKKKGKFDEIDNDALEQLFDFGCNIDGLKNNIFNGHAFIQFAKDNKDTEMQNIKIDTVKYNNEWSMNFTVDGQEFDFWVDEDPKKIFDV